MSDWIALFAAEEVAIGSARSAKVSGRQVAVFHPTDEAWFAVDNQCPHEGYPLVQGYVRDCVLTCAWHNYKFDLTSGACVQGDEDVTKWPLRVHQGNIEVQVPLATHDLPRLHASLSRGVLDADTFRVARDAVRLLKAGVSPEDVAFQAASLDATHHEYGCGHGLALAWDALEILERRDDLEPLLPLTQALDITGDGILRQPARPLPEAVKIHAAPEVRRRDFLSAVEEEDHERAEGMFVSLLAAAPEQAVALLLEAISTHFLGFGHPLIFATKGLQWADRVGIPRCVPLLRGLLFRTLTATREDTLPPMAKTRSAVGELDLESLWREASQAQSTDAKPLPDLVEAILDGSAAEMLPRLKESLSGGTQAVLASLVDAAALRMLRFDTRLDADPTVQDGWLDLTHGLTYPVAIAAAIERVPAPFQLRHLYWAAHFIQRTGPLDQDPPPESAATPTPAELENQALEDAWTLPIFAAHRIKTTLAATSWHRQTGATRPLAAVARMLRSRVQERSVHRAVHEARRFILDGKPPRSLS